MLLNEASNEAFNEAFPDRMATSERSFNRSDSLVGCCPYRAQLLHVESIQGKSIWRETRVMGDMLLIQPIGIVFRGDLSRATTLLLSYV